MIVEVKKNNTLLHQKMETIFPDILKKGQIVNSYINNPFIEYICYQDLGNVIGVLCYTLAYQKMEIIQINVLPKYQNKKIASQMMEYLITLAKQQNVENITLEVKDDNNIAIRLYQKFGFKKIAIRSGYYQGIDGILMEKEMIK